MKTANNKSDIGNQRQYDNNKKSAENKRALYRNSRNNVLSLGAQPKLVRAMSAPLRSFDADSNSWHPRRRTRSKRTSQEQIRLDVDPMQQQKLFFQNNTHVIYKEEKGHNFKMKNKLMHMKSNAEVEGCDIVTLVSLLSPGASDSEKEETTAKNEPPATTRAPPLRRIEKSGKSFQHNISNIYINDCKYKHYLCIIYSNAFYFMLLS